MAKFRWILLSLLLGIFSTVGAYADISPGEYKPENGMLTESQFDVDDIPDAYLEECEHPGRVEEISYKRTGDYPDEKNCRIYLPNGYDETEEDYNVVYMMHGASGKMDTYLDLEKRTAFQNLLDHMIEDEIIEPVIVVVPTYFSTEGDPQKEFLADQVQKYAASFPEELVNDLIPAVESRYRTYAESFDEKGVYASRDHRAIAGFSLGGTVAWYVFIQRMGAFRWFLPISEVSWDDGEGGLNGFMNSSISARVLYDAVIAQGYGKHDFNLYVATGTDDEAFGITTSQMVDLLEYSEMFVVGSNTSCSMMIGGMHTVKAVYTYMYHILPAIFAE